MRDAVADQVSRGPTLALHVLVATTTALIVLGALVRAHEAGLACPDWPLCFGEVLPEMDLRIAFEWSHRALAGSISLIFAAVVFRCSREPELWRRTRLPLLIGAALLVCQILLGALTVWKLLAAWTVTAHLLTGNAFNASLWIAAGRARKRAELVAAPASPWARRAGVAAFALLVLQIALGGLVSSTFAGLACPEWPLCSGGALLPSLSGSVGLHLAHRWNPVLLVIALIAAAALARGTPSGRWWAFAVAAALLQWAVGIANVVLGIPVEVTALHSGLAAALVLIEVWALHESFRGSRRGD
jgi:cytochrome c oxidase assembly protein subunit 15